MIVKMLKNSILLMMTFLMILSMSSCKPQVPDKYIQPDDMEDILYEYHLSQAMAQRRLNSDSVSYYRNMYYRSILHDYGVTEEEFDSSLVYYYTHAYRLHEIYRNIAKRMNEDVEKYGAAAGEIGKYTQYTTDGDTANVWSNVSSAILIPKPTVNRFDFELEADTTYQRGDSFLFNFMTSFLYQSGTKDAVAYIAVQYENDSVYAQTRRISVSGLTQIRIRPYNESDIKTIKGFIYLNKGNDDSNTLKLMFLDQIQLIRFHPLVPVDTTKYVKKDSLHTQNDSIKTADGLNNSVIDKNKRDSLRKDSLRNLINNANTNSNNANNEKTEKLKPIKMKDLKLQKVNVNKK